MSWQIRRLGWRIVPMVGGGGDASREGPNKS